MDPQSASSSSAALRRLANGFRVSQALSVAATLGIADLLAAGPRAIDDLAAAAAVHPDALHRLLRALAAEGVFHEGDGRVFALTPLAEGLRSDAPDSIRDWAIFVGEPTNLRAWGDLLHSVRTGENAFRHVYGVDIWTYRQRHPELSARFDRAMTALSRPETAAAVAAYDFGRFNRVVDIAGGNGVFLAAILAKHPALHGVLFDQPSVAAGAALLLARARVADRCERVGGDFFEAVPPGGDVYLLKSILHDWEDDDCRRILRTVRAAMTPGTPLLIVERDLGRPNERADAKFIDLTMLVAPGGRERTADEYAALATSAGFRFVGVTPSAADTAIFEAVAV
jgi:hypothetical protein